MWKNILFICLIVQAQFSCGAAQPVFELTKDGRATANIVVSESAPAIDHKSAAVLQDYVFRMSGTKLPIIRSQKEDQLNSILIGATAADFAGKSAQSTDGFTIRQDGNKLLIYGGGGKGTLYGVYSLLELLGCRKLDEGATYVPEQKTIRLPESINITEEPAFTYRESFYPAAMDNEYMDWHKLHRFEDLWGFWGHSYFKLVDPKVHFAAHPEYFALVNGKRQATQLCLSNPDVLKLAKATLKEAMADRPEAEYWSIAPMDGAGFCTCESCQKVDQEEGGPQGSLIRFVNKIAESFPDKKFTTLAYTYTANPPKKTKPAENVYIMLSSIDAQRQKDLEREPTAKAFRDQLAGWKEKTDRIFVWDYNTQFTNYIAPFPDDEHLASNISYFKKNGIGGVFSQGSGYTHGDLAELKSYLIAKSLWNSEIDVDAIRQDFLANYYGAAAQKVQSFLDAQHKAIKETNSVLDIYGTPVNSRKDFLKPELIDQYSSLLDEAEAAVESDEIRSARIRKLRLGLEYAVLQQAKLFGREKFGYLAYDPDKETIGVKPGWKARVERFVKACNEAGVTELAEAGIDPKTYGQEWQALLDQGFISGLSLDKPVVLANAFVPDYPAKREVTLTDGMAGGLDYSYNWLLFEQVDLVATIDLGKTQPVQEVQVNYLDDPRHYIFAPDQMIVEVSVDGKTFRKVGSAKPESGVDGEASALRRTQQIKIIDKKIEARFVRVTGVTPKQFPSWFSGNNRRKPLIAVNEITVR
ncbi:DUF4838 domain-containing protein [Sphingobacterium corticis]|uniref:DUF4838 domain-containing protein n=1 Tax=Sphingobacterium corticis TaxID=1812823 RepID=A0ABW5NK34_9SPHI